MPGWGYRSIFQYDPTRDYLEPSLQGLRLVGNAYQPIPASDFARGDAGAAE